MVDNYFIFDGVDCRRFGILAFEKSTFGADAMAYDTRAIPGLDGDLLVEQNRYPNRNIEFGCIIHEDFYVNYERFRSWLMSKTGYHRLESPLHPSEFYLASFKASLEPTIDTDINMGKFDLVFSRKPQRFLKTGERVVRITSQRTLINPTPYASKPLITIYGNVGTLSVGGNTISIDSDEDTTTIDCEIMECYHDSLSNLCNDEVSFSENDFPTLPPGENTIGFNGDFSKVEITPRWFIR